MLLLIKNIMKYVKDNPDKDWNLVELSNNKFKYDKSLQKIKKSLVTGDLKSINKMKYKRFFSHMSQDFWKMVVWRRSEWKKYRY